MGQVPLHPTCEQIELPAVLNCLGDPTRLAIVLALAKNGEQQPEMRCSAFNALGAKSRLAYHFSRLREAGVIRTRLGGPNRFMQLRRTDLDTRFPGLLDAVISSAAAEAKYPLQPSMKEA